MLEVFNTLLRHLKLSVDYELSGFYDATTTGTKTVNEHEERQLQEAVIKTIGKCVCSGCRPASVYAFCIDTLEYPAASKSLLFFSFFVYNKTKDEPVDMSVWSN